MKSEKQPKNQNPMEEDQADTKEIDYNFKIPFLGIKFNSTENDVINIIGNPDRKENPCIL